MRWAAASLVWYFDCRAAIFPVCRVRGRDLAPYCEVRGALPDAAVELQFRVGGDIDGHRPLEGVSKVSLQGRPPGLGAHLCRRDPVDGARRGCRQQVAVVVVDRAELVGGRERREWRQDRLVLLVEHDAGLGVVEAKEDAGDGARGQPVTRNAPDGRRPVGGWVEVVHGHAVGDLGLDRRLVGSRSSAIRPRTSRCIERVGDRQLVEEAHPRLLERPAAHAVAEEVGERPLDPGAGALRGFEGGRVEDDLGRRVGAEQHVARGRLARSTSGKATPWPACGSAR